MKKNRKQNRLCMMNQLIVLHCNDDFLLPPRLTLLGCEHTDGVPPPVLPKPVEQPADPAHRREQQHAPVTQQCKSQHEKGFPSKRMLVLA